MKKVLALYLLYYTLAVVLQGCCGQYICYNYIEVSGGVMRIKVGSVFQQSGTYTVSGDTLMAQVDFKRAFLAAGNRPVSLFNTAYAFQCDAGCENGVLGLKDKVTGITLTSNQPYNGVAAGTSLNDFFRFPEVYTYNTTVNYLPFEKTGFFLNNRSTAARPFNLVSWQKPGNNLLHKLNIRFVFESGKTVNIPAPEFNWP